MASIAPLVGIIRRPSKSTNIAGNDKGGAAEYLRQANDNTYHQIEPRSLHLTLPHKTN